jgi:hypothetical protein
MTDSELDPEPDPVELLQGYGKDLNLLRTLFVHNPVLPHGSFG